MARLIGVPAPVHVRQIERPDGPATRGAARNFVAAPANARAVVVTLRLSAKEANAFRAHLLKVIPVTRIASGFRYGHPYQDTEAPTEFLLLQGWGSVEQQQGYIAWRQGRGDLAEFRALLSKDPIVEVFAPA